MCLLSSHERDTFLWGCLSPKEAHWGGFSANPGHLKKVGFMNEQNLHFYQQMMRQSNFPASHGEGLPLPQAALPMELSSLSSWMRNQGIQIKILRCVYPEKAIVSCHLTNCVQKHFLLFWRNAFLTFASWGKCCLEPPGWQSSKPGSLFTAGRGLSSFSTLIPPHSRWRAILLSPPRLLLFPYHAPAWEACLQRAPLQITFDPGNYHLLMSPDWAEKSSWLEDLWTEMNRTLVWILISSLTTWNFSKIILAMQTSICSCSNDKKSVFPWYSYEK